MDTEEMKSTVRNMVRNGIVSSVNAKNGTVRVAFEDKDKNVSAELPVINRGSMETKDYWLPDVGEQVVCLFASNDKNTSTGWILGTFFSDKDKPQVENANKRRIDFADGTYIEYDRELHELNISCAGKININGTQINLN